MISARSRFLVPIVSTLLMSALLLGLGTWQVYRLRWKEGVLAQIASAEIEPPVPVTDDPAPYTKILASGHFLFDHAAEFGAEVRDTRAGPTMGSYQIVPLERDGAPTILVERGWIPQKREIPLNDPSGSVTVTGYARPADTKHWFSPTDDEAGRQFFTLNPAAIGAAVGVRNLLPFTLVATGPSIPDAYPAPAQQLPRPPNNHLSYAITWYGLAAALVVIFGVWTRKALRS